MRSIGVICVAMGIMISILASVGLVGGESWTEILVSVGCLLLVALPLSVTGLVLTRRFAAKAGPAGEAAASASFEAKSRIVLAVVSLGHTEVPKANPNGSWRERMLAMDLNRVPVGVWLLVVETGVFMLTEMMVFRKWIQEQDMGPLFVVPLFGGVLVALLFFYVGLRFMRAFGLASAEKPDSRSGAEVGSRGS